MLVRPQFVVRLYIDLKVGLYIEMCLATVQIYDK